MKRKRLTLFLLRRAEHFADARNVHYPDALAVPAGTLRVRLAILLHVYLASPFKGRAQLVLVHTIIVINEDALGRFHSVVEIALWTQLVRVPGQVDVEGWDRRLVWMGGNDIDVPGVFT